MKIENVRTVGAGVIAVALLMTFAGFTVGRRAATSGTSARVEAYQRCVALMDRGAQWDESEDSWRCKVVPVANHQ